MMKRHATDSGDSWMIYEGSVGAGKPPASSDSSEATSEEEEKRTAGQDSKETASVMQPRLTVSKINTLQRAKTAVRVKTDIRRVISSSSA